jgi:hypothetical protein
MRRGPVTPALLDALRGSPVKVCDDGGAVAAGALATLSAGPGASDARVGASALERAVVALPRDGAERLEARAYFDALELLERLGATGGGDVVAAALERRLEER